MRKAGLRCLSMIWIFGCLRFQSARRFPAGTNPGCAERNCISAFRTFASRRRMIHPGKWGGFALDRASPIQRRNKRHAAMSGRRDGIIIRSRLPQGERKFLSLAAVDTPLFYPQIRRIGGDAGEGIYGIFRHRAWRQARAQRGDPSETTKQNRPPSGHIRKVNLSSATGSGFGTGFLRIWLEDSPKDES